MSCPLQISSLVCCAIVHGLVFAAVPSEAADSPSFNQIAERVIKHREQISNGHFRIETRVSFGDASTAQGELIDVYLDAPTRLRASSLRDFGEVGPRGESPISPFKHNLSRVDEDVFLYTPVEFEDSPSGENKLAEVFDAVDVYDGLTTDPRLVGLSPSSYQELHKLTLATVMRYGEYDDRYVGETVPYRGQDCIELVSVRGTRANPELKKLLLVAPDLNYNVLHIRLVGSGIDSALDVELQEVPDYGWFPQKVTLKRVRNGELEKSSETNITVNSINQGIDSEVFTLAGMGVPIGARVYDHRRGQLKEMQLAQGGLEPWTSNRDEVDLSQLSDQSSWGMQRWLILANALFVAAVGIALMLRARRRFAGAE